MLWDFLTQAQPFLTFMVSTVGSAAVTYISVRQFNIKRIKARADADIVEDEARSKFRDEIRKELKDRSEEVGRLRSQIAQVMDEHMKCKIETAELKIEVMILKSKMGEAVILPPKP